MEQEDPRAEDEKFELGDIFVPFVLGVFSFPVFCPGLFLVDRNVPQSLSSSSFSTGHDPDVCSVDRSPPGVSSESTPLSRRPDCRI